MKKNIIIVCFCFICGTFFSQVGVNTSNPQGVFHIDGAKDNPSTGIPSIAQQRNDVVVTKAGNLGVGTTTPSTKLEIQTGGTASNPVSGFKLVDGSQGQGGILLSDANGVGKWSILGTTKGAVVGTIDTGSTVVLSSETGGYKYSYYKLTLTKGRWIVNAGLLFNMTANAALGDGIWVHGKLSAVNNGIQYTGYTLEGPSGNATGYASVLVKNATPNSPNFYSGTVVLNVTSPSVTIYLMIENVNLAGNVSYTDYRPTFATTGNSWVLDPSNPNNYFYAIPVNQNY